MHTNTLCDNNCNFCPLIQHPNSKILTKLFNDLYRKFGDEVYELVEEMCINLTVCYNCQIDEFCHFDDCEFAY